MLIAIIATVRRYVKSTEGKAKGTSHICYLQKAF